MTNQSSTHNSNGTTGSSSTVGKVSRLQPLLSSSSSSSSSSSTSLASSAVVRNEATRTATTSMTTTSNGSNLKLNLNHNNDDDDDDTTSSNCNDTNVSKLHVTIVQEMIPYILLCIAVLHGIYIYFHQLYATAIAAATVSTTTDDITTGSAGSASTGTRRNTIFFGHLHVPSIDDCVAVQQQQQQQQQAVNDKCGRPDLFAFQMVSGVVFIVVSIFGLHAWYHHTVHTSTSTTSSTTAPAITQTKSKRYPLTTSVLRLYGYQLEAHIILIINLSYQLWDLYISYYIIEEYNTTIMLLHHIIAASVAWAGLYNSMLSYYATYFLGLTEISSIFLVSLDLHKYFIPSSAATSTTAIPVEQQQEDETISKLFFIYSQHIAGPLFVISFIYYRIVLWYYVSKRLWDDVRFVTTTTTTNATTEKPVTQQSTTTTTPPPTATIGTTTSIAEQIRPHRTYILYIWLYSNLPMGVLQLYFLYQILYEIKAMFF